MYTVKIPKHMPSNYYWYLYRCLHKMQEAGVIKLEYFDPFIHEQFVTCIYINNRCIWIDVRDDSRLSRAYAGCEPDDIILKSNFSRELWRNPPSEYPYEFEQWEVNLLPQLKPFIHGRSYVLAMDYNYDDILYKRTYDDPVYDIVSWSGSGIDNKTSENRLNFYDIVKSSNNKTDLRYWLRKHGEDINDKVKYKAYKYGGGAPNTILENYYTWLATGKYSVNIPGICLSQPFRPIDAVLTKRAIITTKIWQTAWLDFPCVELPYDAYFGTGDIEKTKKVLDNLDNVCYNTLVTQSREWYLSKLSPQGMWENQLLKALKND